MNKYKGSGKCCVFFISIMSLSCAYASSLTCQNDCSINVQFTGEYLAQTCRLTINQASNMETVALPTLTTSKFTAQRNELGETPFTIQVTGCPEKQNIVLSLQADNAFYDAITGNLKNAQTAGMSKDIQLRIRKENGEQLKINQPSSGQVYRYATGNNVESHQFIASYYSAKAQQPTPGNLLVRATVTLNYQ